MATKRKTQNIYEDEVEDLADEGDDTDSDSEEVEQRRPAADDTGDADDTDRDEADGDDVRDPVARAVAQAEARMRHKFKPLKAELEQLRKTVGNAKGAEDTIRTLRMENVFLRLAADTFHDSAAAFKLADLSKVEVDDDGIITGMEDVVDHLADSHPYLIREPDAVADTDWQPPDLPSGRPMNGPRHNPAVKAAASDAALLRKYPALRRQRGW